ncbi:MAG: rhomboid family intramembrane serine protease, partial [Armatimonadetes bacterium]|nr:rhomboid family intramembrane serine protease [Armatimonadota bacterium]
MDRAADPIGKREGDTPEPQPEEPRLRLPWMTVLLTAGLVGAAYGQYLLGGARVRPGGELTGAAIHWLLGAKVNSLIAEGELWRLVTANFLHGSFTHLAWNVFCLLCLGWLVESLYRPTRFLALFLAGGIVGTLASYLVNHEVSLGASAGGMGLLGALLVHNLRYRKELPRRWIRMYPYLLILLGVQLGLDQILQNVDAAGHLGGLVGGAGMALLFESQAVAAAAERKDRFPAPAALAASLLLLAYGGAGVWQFGRSNPEMRSAGQVRSSWSRIRALARVLERRPRMVEARLSRAMLLFTLSNGDEGLVEFQRALRDRPSLARGRGHSRLRNQILEFHELRGFQKFGIQDWDAVLESTLYVIRNA